MSQPAPDRQAAVVAAYQQQSTALRAQLAAVIVALWRALPDYRNASLAQFVAQALPVLTGAMGHMQAATSGYLATLVGLTGGPTVPSAVRTLDVAHVRNGADPADVYGRPFHVVWRQLAAGKPPEEAIAAGERRAVDLALTDVQLAKTHTSLAVLQGAKRVAGYRRVLEGPYSCGLCVVASTARYHKATLMPMHPACDCSIAPIVGDSDPGRVINAPLLAQAHDAVAARFGTDSTAAREIGSAVTDKGKPLLYRDTLIEHTHGELGPILAIRGQAFTGPNDIA
jgi:hypothetical protein